MEGLESFIAMVSLFRESHFHICRGIAWSPPNSKPCIKARLPSPRNIIGTQKTSPVRRFVIGWELQGAVSEANWVDTDRVITYGYVI